METVAAKLPKSLVEAVDRLVRSGRFPNRSEIVRVAVRLFVEESEPRVAASPSRHRSFQRLMRSLGRNPSYQGRWVAVHRGRVIDDDDGVDSLLARVLEREEAPIQVGRAGDRPQLPTVRLPGVRSRRTG